MSRIRGVVANYLASQVRDPGIDSHQHQKDSWHIWRHLRNDTVFSCNLRCLLIFLHGRSRTYRVASLRAGPVGRISYNLYFDCKHVRYVTCDFNKRIYLRGFSTYPWTLLLCVNLLNLKELMTRMQKMLTTLMSMSYVKLMYVMSCFKTSRPRCSQTVLTLVICFSRKCISRKRRYFSFDPQTYNSSC